jgi:protein-tyrosine phosphatase
VSKTDWQLIAKADFKVEYAIQLPMSSKPKVLDAKTPRTPRTARSQFNFSPASVRDGIVHGSERPGHVHPVMGQPMTPRGRLAAVVVQERPSSCPSFPAGELVTDDQVAGWIDTMKEKGIRRVLTLLNQDEISFYASPVVETLSKHFTAVVHVALSAKGALSSVMDALTEAADKKEPIVVHCSTVRSQPVVPCDPHDPFVQGQGRTAIVLALWLHSRYNVTLDVAVEEVSRHAKGPFSSLIGGTAASR